MPELINEKELERYLFDELVNENSRHVFDFGTFDYVINQVYLTGYGKIDLLGFHIDAAPCKPILTITVIELKKELISLDAVAQICVYMKGVKNLLLHGVFKKFKHHFREIEINGILIGACISDDAAYVVDSIKNIIVVEHNFHMDSGINFKHNNCDYFCTNENPSDLLKVLGVFSKIAKKQYKAALRKR